MTQLHLKIQDTTPQEPFEQALVMLAQHPVFKYLLGRVEVVRGKHTLCPKKGWAIVTGNGRLHVNSFREGTAEEWVYVVAHCLLHLGFGHPRLQSFELAEPVSIREWSAACDCFVARLLQELAVGRPPEEIQYWTDFTARNEIQLYEYFCREGIPDKLHTLGTAGYRACDILSETEKLDWRGQGGTDWAALLGQGLAELATQRFLQSNHWVKSETPAQRARRWFVQSFPLLSSLATAFEIVEDVALCRRLSIEVAAVNVLGRKILVNPALSMDEYEWRFVIAHELLHVGLQHHSRRQGRDPFLWNVACDYVINGWLVELEVGKPPKLGTLYDRSLKGWSADAIYERLMKNVRYYRKLISMRGAGLSDILEEDELSESDTIGLDDYFRRCLQQGMLFHETVGRGLLPAGLVEEIRALSQLPPPWEVQLARWLDARFPPLEQRRTYARPSRRQSTSPDIPRPRISPPEGWQEGRTFGVVLDTSGSMSSDLLGRAFGAIVGFCLAREVPAVRLVYCDAEPYDQGYLGADQLSREALAVQGRGGTVLQPAIDFLEKAEDFPPEGPILVITDGYCAVLTLAREHAFLLPEGHRLPFKPTGPVFWMSFLISTGSNKLP